MKHRRHGRHAVKSTGGCMGMLAAAVAFGLLNMGTASAAPTPDAGTLQQDLQTKKEFDKQDVSLGNADIQVEQEQRPSLDLPDTLKVQVNDFKITGQDIYSEESLKSLLADKKGKLVTFRDLQDGADTLSRYFRDKGYIAAHAYLPVQKIENGVVEYAVTVGRFDGITIQNNTKIHESVIKRETAFLKKGDYLTRANLERAVWLLSDLAGADAKAVLTTGEAPGTVHVTLDLNPHNGKQGLFSIDNYGNRSTGYNEYGLDYDFLNLAREGDHLAVGITTTGNELFNWGANYTIPVIRDGMKLTAGYNVLTYQLGDDYQGLDALGHSRVASLGLDYAIQRSQRHNLSTRASAMSTATSRMSTAISHKSASMPTRRAMQASSRSTATSRTARVRRIGASSTRSATSAMILRARGAMPSRRLRRSAPTTRSAPTSCAVRTSTTARISCSRPAASMHSTTSTPQSTSPSAARTAYALTRRAKLRAIRAI